MEGVYEDINQNQLAHTTPKCIQTRHWKSSQRGNEYLHLRHCRLSVTAPGDYTQAGIAVHIIVNDRPMYAKVWMQCRFFLRCCATADPVILEALHPEECT